MAMQRMKWVPKQHNCLVKDSDFDVEMRTYIRDFDPIEHFSHWDLETWKAKSGPGRRKRAGFNIFFGDVQEDEVKEERKDEVKEEHKEERKEEVKADEPQQQQQQPRRRRMVGMGGAIDRHDDDDEPGHVFDAKGVEIPSQSVENTETRMQQLWIRMKKEGMSLRERMKEIKGNLYADWLQTRRVEDTYIIKQLVSLISSSVFRNLFRDMYGKFMHSPRRWEWIQQHRVNRLLFYVVDSIGGLISWLLDQIKNFLAQTLRFMVFTPVFFHLCTVAVEYLVEHICVTVAKYRDRQLARVKSKAWEMKFETPEEEQRYVRTAIEQLIAKMSTVYLSHFHGKKLKAAFGAIEFAFKQYLQNLIKQMIQTPFYIIDTLLDWIPKVMPEMFGFKKFAKYIASLAKSINGMIRTQMETLMDDFAKMIMDALVEAIHKTGLSLPTWYVVTENNMIRVKDLVWKLFTCSHTYVEMDGDLVLEDPFEVSFVKAEHFDQGGGEQNNENDGWILYYARGARDWVRNWLHDTTSRFIKKYSNEFYLGVDSDPYHIDDVLNLIEDKLKTLQTPEGKMDDKTRGILLAFVEIVTRVDSGESKFDDVEKLEQKLDDLPLKTLINSTRLQVNRQTLVPLMFLIFNLVPFQLKSDAFQLPRGMQKIVAELTRKVIEDESKMKEIVIKELGVYIEWIRTENERAEPIMKNAYFLQRLATIENTVKGWGTKLASVFGGGGQEEEPVRVVPSSNEYAVIGCYFLLLALERRSTGLTPHVRPDNPKLMMFDVFNTGGELDKNVAAILVLDLIKTDQSFTVGELSETVNLDSDRFDFLLSKGTSQLITTSNVKRMEQRIFYFSEAVHAILNRRDEVYQYIEADLKLKESDVREDDKIISGGNESIDVTSLPPAGNSSRLDVKKMADDTVQTKIDEYIKRYIKSKKRYLVAIHSKLRISDVLGGEQTREACQTVLNALASVMRDANDVIMLNAGANAAQYKALAGMSGSLQQALAVLDKLV